MGNGLGLGRSAGPSVCGAGTLLRLQRAEQARPGERRDNVGTMQAWGQGWQGACCQRDPWPVSGCGGKGGILGDVWAVALGGFWEAQVLSQTQAAPGVGVSREGQLVVLWLEAPGTPPGQCGR